MGRVVSFRPLRRDDFPLLGAWLADPAVHRWWMERSDPEGVEATYGPAVDGNAPTDVFMIVLGGRDIGMIQRYRLRDHPEWERAIGIEDAAGIDYLLGAAVDRGRGTGSAAIAAFAGDTFAAYPEVAVVVAAPQQANVASWRALEKAGFTRVWEGMLDSDAPADAGPAYVYARRRPLP
ncbi:MAG TPA: GNAT family N-acetyltransferase [Acidimicrobiales bacterium]|nr:GNAT family N-acetyltransferase [Acidimicrobiales bacterium]